MELSRYWAKRINYLTSCAKKKLKITRMIQEKQCNLDFFLFLFICIFMYLYITKCVLVCGQPEIPSGSSFVRVWGLGWEVSIQLAGDRS